MRPRMRNCGLLLTLASSVLLAGAVAAQSSSTGVIRGRVVDEAGQPVAASVSAAWPDGSYRRGTTAGVDGAFALAGLTPGAFDVTVQRLGFRRTVVAGVIVRPSQVTEIAVRLERLAAELAPTIVEATSVPIRRGDTQFDTRVSASAIATLPVGLDLDRALAFTPGSRAGQLWGGASSEANDYRLDGVAMNNPGAGGRLLEPNVSWIEELDVRGLGAPAEYGNFQGGLVDVVTKSGGNTRHGFLRGTVESHALDGSGFVGTEIVPELDDRREAEGESRGPLVRDRIFHYVSAQVVRTDRRALDFLGLSGGRFSPVEQRSTTQKLFGKLTLIPSDRDLANLSLGAIGTRTSNFGLTGRETAEATSRYSAPTLFGGATWEHQLRRFGSIEGRASVIRADERVRPQAGESVPGISTYELATVRDYQNAPFSETRHAATSGATIVWRALASRAGIEHRLAAGADLSSGGYTETRLRNGGMTWRPRYGDALAATFDPANPATWQPHVPTAWGGEVRLATDVRNAAVYAQDELTSGRLTIAPGVRLGAWTGRIAAPGGEKLTAVRTRGVDPRIGIVLDLSRRSSTESGAEPTAVAKLHLGRYHQNLFGRMFDRAAGSRAYTDQDLWEYEGPLPRDPAQRFSVRERDSLAALGLFRPLEHAELSAVAGSSAGHLREPYVDQIVAGVQKLAWGRRLRLEVLYVHRENRDQIALVDRAIASNWTVFDSVQLRPLAVGFGGGPGAVLRDQIGRPLTLPVVYISNRALIDVLRTHARWAKVDPALAQPWVVPGFVDADTARLSWHPDYALENVGAAHRRFDQLQLDADGAAGPWTLALSLAWSDLQGNLPSVTGYDDLTLYGRDAVSGRGPGPFVRPDENIDASGKLGGYSKLDLKARASVALPRGTRAGVFVHAATGDRFTPEVELTPVVFDYTSRGRPLPSDLFADVAGHRIYTATRGSFEYPASTTVDLHVDHVFGRGDGAASWQIAADVFNVFNDRAVTLRNVSLDAQADPAAPVAFAAPLGRVDPRQVRVSLRVQF